MQTKGFFSEYPRAEVSGNVFSLYKDLKWSLLFIDTSVFAYTDFNIYACSKLISWPICGGHLCNRVAVRCSVLQSVLQCAVRCSVLQYIAVCCSVVQAPLQKKPMRSYGNI